ncbi:MAG: hypothetical protein JWN18_404 [Parcubacteria group bacterium]|nr:hypothetical protein [Parcubacteria group bacterium]
MVLLMIWTLFSYQGYGVSVTQTSTPLNNMAACVTAKTAAESVRIKPPRDMQSVTITAVCVPL